MPADLLPPVALVLSWSATYLIHSTGLFAGVWLFLNVHRTAGHALREALWKTALVGSILTASAQIFYAPRASFGGITIAIEGLLPAHRAPASATRPPDPAPDVETDTIGRAPAPLASAEIRSTDEM